MTSQSKLHDYNADTASQDAALAQSQAGNDFSTPEGQIADLEERIYALENKRVNLNTDVFGLFENVTAVPTGIPHDVYDQIKIYNSGGTYRLYWYDITSAAWRYAAGT